MARTAATVALLAVVAVACLLVFAARGAVDVGDERTRARTAELCATARQLDPTACPR